MSKSVLFYRPEEMNDFCEEIAETYKVGKEEVKVVAEALMMRYGSDALVKRRIIAIMDSHAKNLITF